MQFILLKAAKLYIMGDECWDQGAGEEKGAGSERGDSGRVRGGRGGGRWLLMKGQTWGELGRRGLSRRMEKVGAM